MILSERFVDSWIEEIFLWFNHSSEKIKWGGGRATKSAQSHRLSGTLGLRYPYNQPLRLNCVLSERKRSVTTNMQKARASNSWNLSKGWEIDVFGNLVKVEGAPQIRTQSFLKDLRRDLATRNETKLSRHLQCNG